MCACVFVINVYPHTHTHTHIHTYVCAYLNETLRDNQPSSRKYCTCTYMYLEEAARYSLAILAYFRHSNLPVSGTGSDDLKKKMCSVLT